MTMNKNSATFNSVLIANRGEIALRVIRACRALGLRSVAIYTDLDRTAMHVREADDAVRVTNYLEIDAVVAAAGASGAGAIHPGYGFLSERAEFARAVEKAGLKLVGPSAEVMDQMGRKDAAREIAVAAGVPVVPNFSVDEPVPASAYPILVKAAAGGGGKGMRIVRSASEFEAAVASAQREAKSAFGDDTMLIEKYVEHGRHIEVQVFGDSHGNVIHLFERDCSTQRRHQKVLEEAPGPTMTPELRHVVTKAAVDLARHVGYESAGTAEFLLDTATNEVYFLEMNTRLQVEHPVTELAVSIKGGELDLVALQLRIAQGEPLPFAQEDVTLSGHAIEARVYAEDPFNGFLPQAGTAELVRWPELARVDAALESGQVVSTSYDPMLGKIIVHGADREAARRGLVAALDDTAILGLTTNLGFLRALAASDEFRDATIDTAWLDHNTVPAPDGEVARIFAAWAQAQGNPADGGAHPFQSDGWRDGGAPAPVVAELAAGDDVRVHRVSKTAVDGVPVGVVAHTDAPESRAAQSGAAQSGAAQSGAAQSGAALWRLEIDGRVHEAVVAVRPHTVEVVHQGQRHIFVRPDVFADAGAVVGDGTILAPMPGTVLAVKVDEGQEVAEGEVLGVLEAMKMELALKAPYAGTVALVGAKVGDQVALGAKLFSVEAHAVDGGQDA
jgi:acetyl-CoA/propionyl-CoA carboxylase biotin carboxyl carrier protein